MDIMEAMRNRHSVRRYTERGIGEDVAAALMEEIEACNGESGLKIQLVLNEPEAFGGFMAHYGKLVNVRNYLALVGKEGGGLDERLGYYGERLVLKAAMLGLDSCWVALSYSKKKSACRVGPGEALRCVVALGYGENHGVPHKSKPMEALCRADNMPDWFRAGMEAALLAPTAVNQQKFFFTLSGTAVKAEATGGFYSNIDLGIVKYHFELGAGRENFNWA
jgi:hypothetical protein